MVMKNVLLLVHDDEGQETRLQAALDVTRALQGHLRCIDVTELPTLDFDDYTGSGGAMLLANEREREARNKAALELRLASEDVPWDWSDVTDSISRGVLDAAALADIIVLSGGAGSVSMARSIAGDILVHGRKPILAVPPALPHFALGRALVAWDGLASSAATMRACVPLLTLATDVEIFMVRDGAHRAEPAEAAEYLARHGIHAQIREIQDDLHAPDVLILEHCDSWKPDYVLMGAYGRGRLMETFGGVTRRMLARSPVPLVLGH
jgi:nucleotide-binding universal stress UspA family protein